MTGCAFLFNQFYSKIEEGRTSRGGSGLATPSSLINFTLKLKRERIQRRLWTGCAFLFNQFYSEIEEGEPLEKFQSSLCRGSLVIFALKLIKRSYRGFLKSMFLSIPKKK
jgi:hypothetical protein